MAAAVAAAARARLARPADRPARLAAAAAGALRRGAGGHRRLRAINDARGHAAGDDVLRATAGLLREVVAGRRPRVPDRRRRVRARARRGPGPRRRGDRLGAARARPSGSARRSRSASRSASRARAARRSSCAPASRSARPSAAARVDRRSAHDEREGVPLRGHALEAGRRSSPSKLSSAPGVHSTTRPRRAGRRAGARSSACAGPRRAGRAPAVTRGDDHDVELAVGWVGGADPGAAAERAGAGDDHLPRVALEDRARRRPRTRTGSGWPGHGRAGGARPRRRAGRSADFSGCARRAATEARPALATFTNGRPSASRPSSSGRSSVPAAASSRRLERVDREPVGAREVVRGARPG